MTNDDNSDECSECYARIWLVDGNVSDDEEGTVEHDCPGEPDDDYEA